jgi:hypothetical protein
MARRPSSIDSWPRLRRRDDFALANHDARPVPRSGEVADWPTGHSALKGTVGQSPWTVGAAECERWERATGHDWPSMAIGQSARPDPA